MRPPGLCVLGSKLLSFFMVFSGALDNRPATDRIEDLGNDGRPQEVRTHALPRIEFDNYEAPALASILLDVARLFVRQVVGLARLDASTPPLTQGLEDGPDNNENDALRYHAEHARYAAAPRRNTASLVPRF